MIHPHKISMAIKRATKWLIINDYGRFTLGLVLGIIGALFSPGSKIEFLQTPWVIFSYIAILGVIIASAQILWATIKILYLMFYHENN